MSVSGNRDSRWPHRLAVVLVCATFPLIWVGGLVTTYDAGMAVPDWPTTYGYNLFLYPWTTWVAGPWDLFIEHGHRLLGALAGMLTIALTVAVFLRDGRLWMRLVVVAALCLVIFQGVIGGQRGEGGRHRAAPRNFFGAGPTPARWIWIFGMFRVRRIVVRWRGFWNSAIVRRGAASPANMGRTTARAPIPPEVKGRATAYLSALKRRRCGRAPSSPRRRFLSASYSW